MGNINREIQEGTFGINIYFDKNRKFSQNLLTKIRFFDRTKVEPNGFLSKKKLDFLTKLWILTNKNLIFHKNLDFLQKNLFLTKNLIFYENFDFSKKFDF